MKKMPLGCCIEVAIFRWWVVLYIMAIRSYIHLLVLEEVKKHSFPIIQLVLKHTIFPCIWYILFEYLLWPDTGDITLNNAAFGVYIPVEKIRENQINKEKYWIKDISTMKEIHKKWWGKDNPHLGTARLVWQKML